MRLRTLIAVRHEAVAPRHHAVNLPPSPDEVEQLPQQEASPHANLLHHPSLTRKKRSHTQYRRSLPERLGECDFIYRDNEICMCLFWSAVWHTIYTFAGLHRALIRLSRSKKVGAFVTLPLAEIVLGFLFALSLGR